jgi:hypothetical protein
MDSSSYTTEEYLPLAWAIVNLGMTGQSSRCGFKVMNAGLEPQGRTLILQE